jgi:uncharacterized MnhB-related membrane protein
MTALLGLALVLVACSGGVVLLTKSPLAQAVVLSVHGLVLTVAFVAFGAPDVALSQLAVGAAVVPLMVLLALAKTRSGPSLDDTSHPDALDDPAGEASTDTAGGTAGDSA